MIDHNAIRFLADIPPAQASACGNAIALVQDDVRVTYAQLERRSNGVAQALLALGVSPGDRIAWLGRNCIAYFELFFACAKLRACLVPLNNRLAPSEIGFILSDSGAKLLVTAAEFLECAQSALTAVDVQLRIIAAGRDVAGFEHFETLRDKASVRAPNLPPAADDAVVQLYTSGTTGQPKGVVLNNRNYGRFLELSAPIDGFKYNASERVLLVAPLFHVAGVNVGMTALANGCRVILTRDFVPADVLRLIESERVAHLFAVPAMIQMLLQAPEMASADVTSLKSIGYGASPISDAVLLAAKARMACDFVQYYGMTESAGSGTFLAPDAHRPETLRSCGRAWPGLEVRVVRADGEQAAPGEVGEIVIRGDTVMSGYWNRPQDTSSAIQDGWLRTGDAGYQDANGYFYVHDRIKDMIVTGGENVYPAEVENAIAGCPGVSEVAVIGVPSERWGEEVKAVVVASAKQADPQVVIAWAKARIARYKVPKSVDFVDALPRNASGKILRRELRARYWQGRDRAVG